jgi:hypothetical protein
MISLLVVRRVTADPHRIVRGPEREEKQKQHGAYLRRPAEGPVATLMRTAKSRQVQRN